MTSKEAARSVRELGEMLEVVTAQPPGVGRSAEVARVSRLVIDRLAVLDRAENGRGAVARLEPRRSRKHPQPDPAA